ncbi:hypothetical protein [Bradyrhizobium archetypum]|uniref:Uncharacterized protein n=1 Tax=Bradyrhizobium archetypum TaxID=2721160 RepID=A0A7Y4HAF8_9BRAD|nr:hypothetical protein [Bradyrhizobium archetypum]NOJ50616.1 hypothetical protein [Bradyrhizobium archetypum]
MDAAANENEVRLRKGTSLNERLALAGAAALLCLIALPGLVHLASGHWLGIAALFALLFGCLLLGASLLDRNVVWIITPGGILIGEQRPFGKLHKRLIRPDEISKMHLRRNSGRSIEFSLAFVTASEDVLTSPPLPDVTQVHETTVRIARLLRLPDPEPVENPLDAVNAGIRLGKPVNSKRVRGFKVLIVLLAGALSIPFIYALWNDKLSPFGIAVWSLGAIAAYVLLRSVNRMSACWIVHDGAIRIERLSWNGTEVEMIAGSDVEAVDVESGGRKDSLYVITIRLRTGRKIRSPALAGKDQTRAVQAEIVRRLRSNPSGGG